MGGHDTPYPDVGSAMQSLTPLLEVLPYPVHVAAPAGVGDRVALQDRVSAEAERCGVPAPMLVTDLPPGTGVFSHVVGMALMLADSGTTSALRAETIEAAAGTPLRGYAVGSVGAPAVLLVPPCGMPVELIGAWVTVLSANFRVLTWETGGLFGPADQRAALDDSYLLGTPRDRVAAQAADAVRVLQHFGAPQADLVGLCGGAVIALATAADRPDLVRSVSLWHADFLVPGRDCRTQHQANLSAVLEIGARSAAAAASVHDVLCRSLLDSVPADLAHLVLHPYATSEMLYRYCRINGAIMSLNASELVSEVRQPVLVVTSEDDDTAHPNASREVARALSRGDLVVRPHGDHIALFRGSPELFELATTFIFDQMRRAAAEAAEQNRAIL